MSVRSKQVSLPFLCAAPLILDALCWGLNMKCPSWTILFQVALFPDDNPMFGVVETFGGRDPKRDAHHSGQASGDCFHACSPLSQFLAPEGMSGSVHLALHHARLSLGNWVEPALPALGWHSQVTLMVIQSGSSYHNMPLPGHPHLILGLGI